MFGDDYGKELIIDLHNCNSELFTRKNIRNYFKDICKSIDMKAEKLCWWDDLHTPEIEKETEDHLIGTSAIQFIRTSNITIHTLDKLKKVYINIFSCKDFDKDIVILLSQKWFDGIMVNNYTIRRI